MKFNTENSKLVIDQVVEKYWWLALLGSAQSCVGLLMAGIYLEAALKKQQASISIELARGTMYLR